MPQELLNKIKAKISFNTVYYFCKSAYKLAKDHKSKIEDEPTGNHMGYTIAYLKKGKNMLD